MADAQPSLYPSLGHQMFLLSLLQVGCLFFSSPASDQRQSPPPRRRKISPFSQPEPSPSPSCQSQHRSSDSAKPKLSSHNNSSSSSLSIRSYLRQLFSFSSPMQQDNQQHAPPAATAPTPIKTISPERPPPPQQQLRHYLVSPETASPCTPKITPPLGSPVKPSGTPESCDAAVVPIKRPSFASRADIYPCASCGEVFNKAHLLELHQAARHAFSELPDGDSGKNIVSIIFQSGWKGRSTRGATDEVVGRPAIHRILKVHHSPRTLARFEEYRDAVRARAAVDGVDERCAVDGNERLRFYCATFLCGLGRKGNTGTCDSPFCAACGIVRHGFSGKDAEGVSTHSTGWAAHSSLPEELEKEFAFVRFRRAILVCRVVAGRVAPGKAGCAAPGREQEEEGGDEYDSVVVAAARKEGGGACAVDGELVVFNARAVLPCFVIVYSCCV